MIPRYTRPAMGRVWSDEHRMELWLKVELAVCEAWADMGVIPEEDMAAIRGATVQAERSAELFRETHHDMIAFTWAVAERIGPPGRWIHLGLTSSDVLDTALSLQIQEAADIVAEDLRQLEEVLPWLRDGTEVSILRYQDKVIGVELPLNVELEVTETEPGIRGDTVSASFKPARVETGASVNVPLFVNQGDIIKIDTRTGAYLERV